MRVRVIVEARQAFQAAWTREMHKRNRHRGPPDAGEPCPVEPDRPLGLSGGAAAALEFDD